MSHPRQGQFPVSSEARRPDGTSPKFIRSSAPAGSGLLRVDIHQVELTATLAEGVSVSDVLAAIERAGLQGFVGAGKGAYLPHERYPEGADLAVLSADGSAVGPLAKLRTRAKYTIFDVYADWCGPCRSGGRSTAREGEQLDCPMILTLRWSR